MRKAILILACLSLFSTSSTSQQKRSKPKPKPKNDADLFQNIPKDEMLWDEDDKYITLSGWRLAVQSDLDASGGQTLTYYDLNRITLLRGTKIKQAWLKGESKKNGILVSYWLDLEEFDCGQSRTRVIESHEYDKNGNQTKADIDKPTWQRLIPDSMGEGLFGILCRGEKDQQQSDKDGAARFFMVARGFEKKNDRGRALTWYKWALEHAPDNQKILAAIERVK